MFCYIHCRSEFRGFFDVIVFFVVQAWCERTSYFLDSGWLNLAILLVTSQKSMGRSTGRTFAFLCVFLKCHAMDHQTEHLNICTLK